MPSTSGPQHRMMEAIAHGEKPTSGHGPSPEVAKDFVAADKAAGKSWPKHGGPRQYGDPGENFKTRMARGQHSKSHSGSNLEGSKTHPSLGGDSNE